MKAVLACDPWTLDEGSLTAPWRQVDIGKGKEEEAKSLRLGFILEDSIIHCTLPFFAM